MNILAIETATPACAIALATTDGFERAVVFAEDLHHTEVLTPGVRELLEEANLDARDIERVVVDRGPGLFTGLRVGIATAIGFALATGADLVGVTSLELLAASAHHSGTRGTLVAGVDGRRGELFVQTFALATDVVAIDEPQVTKPSEVVIRWRESDAVAFIGDGIARYGDDFRELENATILDERVPSALEALRFGSTREPSAQITPLYLREADAIANFSTRERS